MIPRRISGTARRKTAVTPCATDAPSTPSLKPCLVAASDSTTSDRAQQRQQQTVQFGTVTVLRFEVTLGDNPACSCGCPVALEPQHCETTVYHSVGKYYRSEVATRPIGYGRRGRDLVISKHRRKLRLEEFGYSAEEIKLAAMEASRLRKLRAETLESSKTWDKMFKKFPKYIFKSLNRSVGSAAAAGGSNSGSAQSGGGSLVRKSSAATTA